MPTYIRTPLAKKLGIKKDDNIFLHNAPKDYFERLEVSKSDFRLLNKPYKESLDFIHVFVRHKHSLELISMACMIWLKKSGMMWISWPKGSSKISTDLKRDSIREYLLHIGLVDVKVASFDDDWSGLKFVWRLRDR